MMALLSFDRFIASIKNDDLPFLIGPEKLPPKRRCCVGARFGAKGLREFRLSSLNAPLRPPRNSSEPGFVRISIRPLPGLSYSAENGLLLMRISRIDSFG